MVEELMKIVDEFAKIEDVVLFVKEKTQGIKCPNLEVEGDKVKTKHKKNAKGGKVKKNNFEEVFTYFPNTRPNNAS